MTIIVKTRHGIPERPDISSSPSNAHASTHWTCIIRETIQTFYTHVVTTWKLTNMGNLVETHRTLDTHAIMMITVHGINLARGGARSTVGSDGLA
jgi:hypothetical protein